MIEQVVGQYAAVAPAVNSGAGGWGVQRDSWLPSAAAQQVAAHSDASRVQHGVAADVEVIMSCVAGWYVHAANTGDFVD